jgi:hypothetical protein
MYSNKRAIFPLLFEERGNPESNYSAESRLGTSNFEEVLRNETVSIIRIAAVSVPCLSHQPISPNVHNHMFISPLRSTRTVHVRILRFAESRLRWKQDERKHFKL